MANSFFSDFEQELELYNGKRAPMSPKNNNSSFMSETMIHNIVNGRPSLNSLTSLKYSQMKDEING